MGDNASISRRQIDFSAMDLPAPAVDSDMPDGVNDQIWRTIFNNVGAGDAATQEAVIAVVLRHTADNATSDRNVGSRGIVVDYNVPGTNGVNMNDVYATIRKTSYTLRQFGRCNANVTSRLLFQQGHLTAWGKKWGFPLDWLRYAFDCADAVDNIPVEVLHFVNAKKQAAIQANRSQNNQLKDPVASTVQDTHTLGSISRHDDGYHI